MTLETIKIDIQRVDNNIMLLNKEVADLKLALKQTIKEVYKKLEALENGYKK